MTKTTPPRMGAASMMYTACLCWLPLLLSSAYASLSPSEQLFVAVPNADSARRNLRFITSRPHVAGTAGDKVMAHYVKRQFQTAGIPDVSIFELDVLLNYPQRPPQVTLVSRQNQSHVLYQASLSEPPLDFDDTSNKTNGWDHYVFHGYGASGTVVAPVVFANYGRPQDFDALERAGVSVEHCIVLVRYGECFRGLKVMNAQERGALGVIIYSDPFEDGFVQGKVYPDGPWRPAFGIQRGSVQFNSKCAGDPMRADERYRKDNNQTMSTTQRICGVRDYTELIPSIPSVPMGYGDALHILQSLGGNKAKDVFENFTGGLPICYTIGPSRDTVVRLSIDHVEEIRTIPNVIGLIKGTLPESQDMPVLMGNHRDAWVFGAADPNSGTASLIEVARGLGKLLNKGWKPRRSVYLLSWSGEEYGLLGSTGWAELNSERIRNAVAYLNADTMVSGDILSVSTTPALASLWESVLDDLDAANAISFANGPRGLILDANTNKVLNHPEHGMLGSGSDYTVFLDHFGIASLDFSFGKSTHYGQYHSIYDSFSWMAAYGGRKNGNIRSAFELMAFGAEIWGLLALRLADSMVLPVDQIVQGEALRNYTSAIEKQQCALDLTPLKKAVQSYQKAAATLHVACSGGMNVTTLDALSCNEKLGLTERHFLSVPGLPERPWFKHILQAPGLYLGYSAEAFPGIQQAIDADDLDLAQRQVLIAAERIESAAFFMLQSENVKAIG